LSASAGAAIKTTNMALATSAPITFRIEVSTFRSRPHL
jgi:hypothetical protein